MKPKKKWERAPSIFKSNRKTTGKGNERKKGVRRSRRMPLVESGAMGAPNAKKV